jgi:hypothetical protein
VTILIFQIILGFSFPFFAAYHEWSFGICLCLIFAAEGAHFTLMPIMMTRLFSDNAELIYPLAFSFLGFSQVLTMIVELWILNGDYVSSYYMGSAMCMISAGILLFVFKDEPYIID